MLVKKCDLIFPLFGKGSAICRAPAGGGAVSASAVLEGGLSVLARLSGYGLHLGTGYFI